MPIKLKNLSKWTELQPDHSIMCRGDNDGGKRKIVLNINTDAPMRFSALEHGVECFLGVVNGQDTIEFTAEGEVEVSADGDGTVWYWTDDGDAHSYEHAEGYKLFVRPFEEESRSPEMEALAAKLEERHARRMALANANNERLYAQLEAEREVRVALERQEERVDDGPGSDGEQQPEPGVAPAAAAASAGEGNAPEPAKPAATT